MERLLVFVNRKAGYFSPSDLDAPFRRYAREAGFEPEIVATRTAQEFRWLLEEQVVGKVGKVAIAGGDGTIHNAAQVLAKTDVTLGILPQGTANNFASALRLPLDLPSAFQVIAKGEERAVDLGEADGEYFTEAAGVGLFADALRLSGSNRPTKSIFRSLKTIFRLWVMNKSYRLRLVIDGERHVENAVMVTVANSFRIGYALPIAPSAKVTDGELDVVIFGDLNRSEYLRYLRAVRAQSHTELPKVEIVQAKTVEIRAKRRLNVHVDDRVCRRTPITLKVAPEALKVMVDRL